MHTSDLDDLYDLDRDMSDLSDLSDLSDVWNVDMVGAAPLLSGISRASPNNQRWENVTHTRYTYPWT